MGAKKMGYQGLLYRGAAGSTASNLLENVRDVKYAMTPKVGNTTVKGDGSVPPIETGETTSRAITLTWTMIHDASDTHLTSLRASAAAGTAVALRYITHSGGTGPDIDAVLSCDHGAPLNGEQTFDFAVVAVTNSSRTPALNS